MTIRVRQHIPGFVDTHPPYSTEVDSLAALLAIPWIASWAHDDLVAKDGHVSVRPFYRWSVADRGTSRQTLMAEFENGDHFWVVAFLDSDQPIDLPDWTENDTARVRRERWNRGDTA
jgi:hypothetical protein